MLRAFFLTLSLVAAPVALPAPAHGQSEARSNERCQQRNRTNQRRRSVFGGIARSMLGRVGAPSAVSGVALPVGSLLSDVIIRLLNCREQEQAATATEEAVRGGVGTTTTWTSESRANVTGSSTVVAAEPVAPDGGACMTVTDIVIVDGEETRAPKRMCRRPPSTRYVRV